MALNFQDNKKLSPNRDEHSTVYFESASNGILMIKHCPSCDKYAQLQDRYCGKCLTELQWNKASGRGKVMNWTVIHQAAHPGFIDEIPYVAGTIMLEENVRILSKISRIDPKELTIDLDVHAEFEQWPNGEFLPVFVPSK